MILYITTGTVRYLSTLQDRHPDLLLNAIGTDAILYREGEDGNPVFDSVTKYDILHQQGELSQEKTVSAHYFPVAGSGSESIRGHLSDLNQKLQTVKGLTAYRIGRALSKDAYVVFMQWADGAIISDFKDTDIYKNYMSPDALKKFRNIGSVFQSSISSKVYLPIEENEKRYAELPEDEKEDY